MKKFTTQIIKNNVTKTIFAMVDDKTAKLLEGLDEQTRHEYIVSEHEMYLSELKETRRHQSLELSLDNGHDFVCEDPTPDEKIEKQEEIALLGQAITTLTEEQRWLINEVYYKKRTLVNIANELGVSHVAIINRLKKIHNKIKKFLI